MSPRGSNSCSRKHHPLSFFIEGAEITVDEMGQWVAAMVNFPSEALQEQFARDAAHEIYEGVGKKVVKARALNERAKIRRAWMALHPPNHAGFYYCHIGGEWVHQQTAELEDIVPVSVAGLVDMSEPGWDEKLRMACHTHNYLKGSRQDIPSATLEFAPPDEEC